MKQADAPGGDAVALGLGSYKRNDKPGVMDEYYLVRVGVRVCKQTRWLMCGIYGWWWEAAPGVHVSDSGLSPKWWTTSSSQLQAHFHPDNLCKKS